MNDDYLWDRSGPPDPDVARLEQLLAPLRQPLPLPPLRALEPSPRPAPSRAAWIALSGLAAATAMIAAGGVWLVQHFRPAPAAWSVTRVEGAASIGARAIGDHGDLPAGRWLETGDAGRATMDVASVGRIDVDPNTKVGVVGTRPGEYRLQLVRGTLHAQIWAPPGQFFVQTPSSTAIDLGCAYTLTTDEDGTGVVRVTTGWVGFELKGREAFIPAGAVCHTRPAVGPGTPHYEDKSPEFLAAIETIDFGRPEDAAAALTRVLTDARAEDSFTVWHLLTRVEPSLRGQVFDRLAQLVPAPSGVTREGVARGQRDMLDRWWDALGFGTAAWWRSWEAKR